MAVETVDWLDLPPRLRCLLTEVSRELRRWPEVEGAQITYDDPENQLPVVSVRRY